MGFAEALRTLMRQDPDVIMVGEIRDHETAEAALHAASTGHLVLTTVHANNAKEILTRLEGLSIGKEPIESALLFASAQRLPKKLCLKCKIDAPENKELAEFLFPDEEIDFTPQTSKGCKHCNHTGVGGRILLFEYLKKDETKLRAHELLTIGSLRKSAFNALKKGEISAKEAYSQFS